jgi:hypothetical protein
MLHFCSGLVFFLAAQDFFLQPVLTGARRLTLDLALMRILAMVKTGRVKEDEPAVAYLLETIKEAKIGTENSSLFQRIVMRSQSDRFKLAEYQFRLAKAPALSRTVSSDLAEVAKTAREIIDWQQLGGSVIGWIYAAIRSAFYFAKEEESDAPLGYAKRPLSRNEKIRIGLASFGKDFEPASDKVDIIYDEPDISYQLCPSFPIGPVLEAQQYIKLNRFELDPDDLIDESGARAARYIIYESSTKYRTKRFFIDQDRFELKPLDHDKSDKIASVHLRVLFSKAIAWRKRREVIYRLLLEDIEKFLSPTKSSNWSERLVMDQIARFMEREQEAYEYVDYNCDATDTPAAIARDNYGTSSMYLLLMASNLGNKAFLEACKRIDKPLMGNEQIRILLLGKTS